MNSSLKIELPRFIAVGIGAVLIDSIVYASLIHIISASPAKAVSFLCGTAFAYIFNKYWTFEKKEKNRKEMFGFLTLYTCTLFINVGVNKLGLVVLAGISGHIILSFLIATGASTVLNFAGQKLLIFK